MVLKSISYEKYTRWLEWVSQVGFFHRTKLHSTVDDDDQAKNVNSSDSTTIGQSRDGGERAFRRDSWPPPTIPEGAAPRGHVSSRDRYPEHIQARPPHSGPMRASHQRREGMEGPLVWKHRWYSILIAADFRRRSLGRGHSDGPADIRLSDADATNHPWTMCMLIVSKTTLIHAASCQLNRKAEGIINETIDFGIWAARAVRHIPG